MGAVRSSEVVPELRPDQLEDLWIIYFEPKNLVFYASSLRKWTGMCDLTNAMLLRFGVLTILLLVKPLAEPPNRFANIRFAFWAIAKKRVHTVTHACEKFHNLIDWILCAVQGCIFKMPLEIPSLGKTHCVALTACGELVKPSSELKRWMRNQERMTAPLKGRPGKGYFRVYFAGSSGSHVHLDLLSASMVVNKPKNVGDIEEVLSKLQRFEGLEIIAALTAKFEVPLSELPQGGIIRSIFFQTQTGEVSIKVSGAQFAISGAPITGISWLALPGDKIGVVVEAENVKTTFTPTYLTKALETLEKALNVFVLGKTP